MMARLLYRLLLLLLVPALCVRLVWRSRKQPEYLRHLGERLGRYRQRPKLPILWLHAVSVGETRAAAPLVKALTELHPDHQLVVSCMTPTGRAAAVELYGSFATVVYLPYDFAFAQRRFLRHFRPSLGILLETELWPNLLFEAKRAQVPMVLVNARLSVRSAKGYARFGDLIRPALATLAAVSAQTAADAARLSSIGASAPVVTGNLKYEVQPDLEKLQQGTAWRNVQGGRFVWLAASTREGEEALILDAYARLIERGEEHILLVLVPRHPQRFAEVAALVEARGFRLTRRSSGVPDSATQIWLGDSMGEMAAYYAMADLCVIGGSLLPYGSQNLIEACACECPVLIGPSDFNFQQAAQFAIAAGAAKRIGETPDSGVSAPHFNIGNNLGDAVHSLVNAPGHLASMRRACGEFAVAHQGATDRTLAVIEKVKFLHTA